MANVFIEETTLTAIGDAIRSKTGSEDLILPSDMPAAIEGISAGGDDRYDEGYADAVQAEYDRFWDAYQDNGNRTKYNHAFAGTGWTNEYIQPKYPLCPTSDIKITAYMMFRENTKATDISHLSPLYIKNAQYAFSLASNLQHLGKIVITYGAYQPFGGCTNLGVIDELTIKSGALSAYSSATNPWHNCPNLTYVKFVDSVLDQSINLSSSVNETTITLPADIIDADGTVIATAGHTITETGLLYNPTITTLIGSLKDFSETTTTMTLTLGDINKAELTEEDIATITQKGWTLA